MSIQSLIEEFTQPIYGSNLNEGFIEMWFKGHSNEELSTIRNCIANIKTQHDKDIALLILKLNMIKILHWMKLIT